MFTKAFLRRKKEFNLSNPALMKLLMVSRPTLKRINSGQMSLDTLDKLCAIYKMRVVLIPEEWVNEGEREI